MTISTFAKGFVYRCWQFYKAVFPSFNTNNWKQAIEKADPRIKPLLNQLGRAEKAHILRILDYISKDNNLSEAQKAELSCFALVHDIGKAITKPTLAFKVAKVLFKLNGNGHCIAGAKAVWRLTHNKQLALRILHHHKKETGDKLIKAFQEFDDRA